jgi:hypothetical protein
VNAAFILLAAAWAPGQSQAAPPAATTTAPPAHAAPAPIAAPAYGGGGCNGGGCGGGGCGGHWDGGCGCGSDCGCGCDSCCESKHSWFSRFRHHKSECCDSCGCGNDCGCNGGCGYGGSWDGHGGYGGAPYGGPSATPGAMPPAGGERIAPPKDGGPDKKLPPGGKVQGNPVVPEVTPTGSSKSADGEGRNPF